jgi:two-component sensor histidine kinase
MRRPIRAASLLAAVVVTDACVGASTPPRVPMTTLAAVSRLDRGQLERGHAVDIDAVTVFHDPSWERLIVQEDGHCIAVDASGVDPALQPGERVHVGGFTAFERNGPMIVLPRLTRQSTRGVRAWDAATATLPDVGVACVEVRARVQGVRQLDSEHLSLEAGVDGQAVEGIVMDVANAALLRAGDTVVLRGPVEALPVNPGAAPRWRIYLQGEGAFERVGAPLPAPPTPVSATGASLPPLTSLLAIKMLSPAEAGRGLPVRVRGVVTGASEQASNGAQEILVQDADCGLYATTESAADAASFGSLVELEGRTAPGAFAPIIIYSKVRPLGAGSLPSPLPVAGLDAGLSARTENVWSVAKGVLRPNAGEFVVATPDGELPLFFFTGDARSLHRLVDAEVEVSGVFAVIHRARRVVGYRLLVQSPDRIRVTAAAADDKASRNWPIAQLFQYWPAGRPLHRISIQGTVTGVFHPNRVYVDDGTAGTLCETETRPRIGAVVSASGFLPIMAPEHRLTRARIMALDPGGSALTSPPLLTIDEIFGGAYDSRPVRVDGRLRERTRSMGREWLTLEAGQHVVAAVLELPAPTAWIDGLRVGSDLRVTGIGEMEWDRSRVPPRVRAARILMRAPADVQVLRAASWWTRGRIAGLLATALALGSVSLVWSVVLRRQVRHQTRLIRDQMTSLRDQSEERERANAKLEKLLAEQLSLLREVHHRVKNNLQAVIHLVDLEHDRIDDPRARGLLAGLRQRAETMALVYEQVYQSPSVARVDMDAYLEALGERLREFLGAGRQIAVEVGAVGVTLDVAQAMPCGLIVNELVTNAFKYAFPPGVRDHGHIRVALGHENGIARLEVADDGIGIPADSQRPHQGSVGLELVSLWATHQLGGRIERRSDGGTAFTVEFPTDG